MTLEDLFPPKYLAKRPSYARCAARAAKHGVPLTRDQYAVLTQNIRKLSQLLKAADVPEDAHVSKYVVNSWGKDNFQVKAFVEPGTRLLPPALHKPKHRAARRYGGQGGVDTVFVPDTHFGFNGSEPIHDERALACVLAVCEFYQPSHVVVLGDWLDLAGFSSFSTSPALRNQVNAALEHAHYWLAEFRAACPQAVIWLLEGNHEARIARCLADVLPELHGVKRPGDSEPVHSLVHLLRLAELGIEYKGPYKTHFWLDGVRILHGELLGKKGGETAAKMLDAYREPAVCGHNHRLELAYMTVHTEYGAQQIWAMSCGTLARLDPVVPGAHYPDWQQGFGLLSNGVPMLVPIKDGSCSVFGQVFG